MKGDYNIVGSCNGLLCLSHECEGEGNVFLWNPTIRLTSKMFPIGVDPSMRITYYGFGYDNLIDKYKLLIVMEGLQETVTKIYTFGVNSWTVIPTSPKNPVCSHGKYVSGTLNWLAKGGENDDQWVILSLDLGTEMYSEYSLPRDGDCDKICSTLIIVLGNRLYVCFFDSKNVHVWLMKEYGIQDSWTKLMMVPHLIQDSILMDSAHRFFELLSVSEDGVVLFRTTFGKLVRYSLNDGRLDYPRTKRDLGFNLVIYNESLVSPEC